MKQLIYNSLQTLKNFLNFIQTQFQTKIKIIKSDNTLKFIHSCQPFFTENNITHQTSYIDRPQQNGKIQKKHRHILKITRTIKIHSSLPLKY